MCCATHAPPLETNPPAGCIVPLAADPDCDRQNDPMQYGVILTSGDPRAAAELAAEAEAAGWDGVFTFDAIAIDGQPLYDPWVVLAAIAMRTDRVRLGAMVFAPTRRRPWNFAHQAITLDILSNGRLVLPVGLGTLDDQAFGNVGEPTDARTRARRLDETLAIVEGLGSGEPFSFQGEHYRFGPMTMRPGPVQRPRIPVWVIGAWPHERSMRRARALGRDRGPGSQRRRQAGGRPGAPAGDRGVVPSGTSSRTSEPSLRDRRGRRDAGRRRCCGGGHRSSSRGCRCHLVGGGRLDEHGPGRTAGADPGRAATGRLISCPRAGRTPARGPSAYRPARV